MSIEFTVQMPCVITMGPCVYTCNLLYTCTPAGFLRLQKKCITYHIKFDKCTVPATKKTPACLLLSVHQPCNLEPLIPVKVVNRAKGDIRFIIKYVQSNMSTLLSAFEVDRYVINNENINFVAVPKNGKQKSKR